MSLILIATASFPTKPHLSSKAVLSDCTHEPPVKKGKTAITPRAEQYFVFHHAAHMYSIVPQNVCVTVPS